MHKQRPSILWPNVILLIALVAFTLCGFLVDGGSPPVSVVESANTVTSAGVVTNATEVSGAVTTVGTATTVNQATTVTAATTVTVASDISGTATTVGEAAGISGAVGTVTAVETISGDVETVCTATTVPVATTVSTATNVTQATTVTNSTNTSVVNMEDEGVTASATELNQCDNVTLLNTTATQNFAGKTSTDGFRVTGGALKIAPASGAVSQITGNATDQTATALYAGGYTSSASTAAIVVTSKDHATLPGRVFIYGTDGTTGVIGLDVKTDGKVNLPVGLQIGGVDVPAPMYEELAANGDLSGSIWVTKVGRQVTMTFESLTHLSDNGPSSLSGLIPTAYQPIVTVNSDFNYDYEPGSVTIRRVTVTSTGLVSFSYPKSDGTLSSHTSTASGTLSWVSAS